MPITGLSERRRIPRLGKIRTGIKAKNEKGVEYPKAVDYFVCDDPRFRAIYGDKPQHLTVCFPGEDPEQFASQYYRAYSRSRGLICKGDGETCNRLVDLKTGGIAEAKSEHVEWKDMTCAGRNCPEYQSKQCKELMMLQFLLPEVEGLGIWQLDTGSINTILNINSAIDLVRRVIGHISMVPLELAIVPMEASPDGKKKTIHVLTLEIKMRLADLRSANMLPEPDDEIPEELFPTPEQQEAAKQEEQSVPSTAVIDASFSKLQPAVELEQSNMQKMHNAPAAAVKQVGSAPTLTKAQVIDRYVVRYKEALALGIAVEAVDLQAMTIQQIRDAGLDLLERIELAQKVEAH